MCEDIQLQIIAKEHKISVQFKTHTTLLAPIVCYTHVAHVLCLCIKLLTIWPCFSPDSKNQIGLWYYSALYWQTGPRTGLNPWNAWNITHVNRHCIRWENSNPQNIKCCTQSGKACISLTLLCQLYYTWTDTHPMLTHGSTDLHMHLFSTLAHTPPHQKAERHLRRCIESLVFSRTHAGFLKTTNGLSLQEETKGFNETWNLSSDG